MLGLAAMVSWRIHDSHGDWLHYLLKLGQ